MEQEQPTISEATTEELAARHQAQEILTGDQANFAELMLEENSIPKEIHEQLPVFADKEFALTNLQNGEQVELLRLMFEDSVNDIHLYSPHYEQEAKIEKQIGQLRAKNLVKVYRSTGGRDRERALYNSMFTSSDRPNQLPEKGGLRGFFRRTIG